MSPRSPMAMFGVSFRTGHRNGSTLTRLAAIKAAAAPKVQRLLPPHTPTPQNTLIAWERLALAELSRRVRQVVGSRDAAVTWTTGELREDGYATAALHVRGLAEDKRSTLSALVLDVSAQFDLASGQVIAAGASIARNLLVDPDTAEQWCTTLSQLAPIAQDYLSTDAWRASWGRVKGLHGIVQLGTGGAYYAFLTDAADAASAWIEAARACGQTGCFALQVTGGGHLGAAVADQLGATIAEALEAAREAAASGVKSQKHVDARVDALREYQLLLDHLENELGMATAALREAHASAVALTASLAPSAAAPRVRLGKAGVELLNELELTYGAPDACEAAAPVYAFLRALADLPDGDDLADDLWGLSFGGIPFADLVSDGLVSLR